MPNIKKLHLLLNYTVFYVLFVDIQEFGYGVRASQHVLAPRACTSEWKGSIPNACLDLRSAILFLLRWKLDPAQDSIDACIYLLGLSRNI